MRYYTFGTWYVVLLYLHDALVPNKIASLSDRGRYVVDARLPPVIHRAMGVSSV